jgi:Leucine-rich repeat (LRR) protein
MGGNYTEKDRHECDWYGITCGNNTNVTKSDKVVTDIAWPEQVLKGSLPTMGLHLLTALTTLDLANNKLQGPIPETLYDLTALHNLYLHENAFTGTISTQVGRLTALRRLYLGGNQLTGLLPAELGSPGLELVQARPLGMFHC